MNKVSESRHSQQLGRSALTTKRTATGRLGETAGRSVEEDKLPFVVLLCGKRACAEALLIGYDDVGASG